MYQDYRRLGYEGMRKRMFAIVTLHDDFLIYIADSLRWIASYNPAKRKDRRQNGFNFHAITAVGQDGARLAERVFESWAVLFSQGPPQLNLRGPYTKKP